MESFQLGPISAAGPIHDAVGFCKPQAAISGIDVQVSGTKDCEPIVVSHELRLQQIVINLISNAVKHSFSGGTIRIKMHTQTLEEVQRLMDSALACGETSFVVRKYSLDSSIIRRHFVDSSSVDAFNI